MKIHKFQIEVMWLMLEGLSCVTTADYKGVGFSKHPAIRNIKKYSIVTAKERPPP